MKTISVEEVKQQIVDSSKLVVVDIREAYERDICHIEGSIHVPMGNISKRVGEIPSTEKIGILCRSGKRAEATVNLLEKDFEIDNVYLIEGGILQWIETIDSTLENY